MNVEKIRHWWEQRAPKEQRGMKIALALVALALLWTLALAPALRTLRSFEANQLKLDTVLQTMLSLQAQAQTLQSTPRLSLANASQVLRETVQTAFGKSADFTINGESATVTLRGVNPDSLARWLSSARAQAHSVPVQATLSNSPAGWSGTLQMSLPKTP